MNIQSNITSGWGRHFCVMYMEFFLVSLLFWEINPSLSSLFSGFFTYCRQAALPVLQCANTWLTWFTGLSLNQGQKHIDYITHAKIETRAVQQTASTRMTHYHKYSSFTSRNNDPWWACMMATWKTNENIMVTFKVLALDKIYCPELEAITHLSLTKKLRWLHLPASLHCFTIHMLPNLLRSLYRCNTVQTIKVSSQSHRAHEYWVSLVSNMYILLLLPVSGKSFNMQREGKKELKRWTRNMDSHQLQVSTASAHRGINTTSTVLLLSHVQEIRLPELNCQTML